MYTYYCAVNKSLALWDKMGYSTCRLFLQTSIGSWISSRANCFSSSLKSFLIWLQVLSMKLNFLIFSHSSVPCSCLLFLRNKSELSDASSNWALNFRMTSGYWPFVVGFLFISSFSMSLALFNISQNCLVCRWWWWCEQDFHVRC